MDNQDTGQWTVTTETGSVYSLDLDARTVTRNPAEGELRRDGEELALYRVAYCEVGMPLNMMIGVREDRQTWRLTSAITSIERVQPEDATIQ